MGGGGGGNPVSNTVKAVDKGAAGVAGGKRTGVGNWAEGVAKDPYRAGRAVATSGVTEGWRSINDPARKKAEEGAEAEDAARAKEYEERYGTMGKMAEISDKAYEEQTGRLKDFQKKRTEMDSTADLADDTYSNSIVSHENEQQGRVKELMGKAEEQATNANKVYTESLQPSFKNAMEDADKTASTAMSMNEAGDMNNKVQTGVRDFFDKRASNESRSGLADVGIMQSLGAQATAQQMGGGQPMTGSQLAMLSSQNAQQGGQAFANVQRRVQGLRQQGIEQGMAQSDKQYERGERSKEQAGRRRGEFMGAEGDQAQRTASQRGERYGYGSELMRSAKTQAGSAYGAKMSKYQRGMDRTGQFYNQDTGIQNQRLQDVQSRELMAQDIKLGQLSDERMKAYGQMQSANAEIAGRNAMLGAGIQAVGTGAGAYFGGAQGAAAGNSLGGAVGGGVSQSMNASNPYAYAPPPQQRQGINTYGGYGQGGYG